MFQCHPIHWNSLETIFRSINARKLKHESPSLKNRVSFHDYTEYKTDELSLSYSSYFSEWNLQRQRIKFKRFPFLKKKKKYKGTSYRNLSQRVTNLQIIGHTHRKSVSLAFERHFVKKAHGQIESKKEEKKGGKGTTGDEKEKKGKDNKERVAIGDWRRNE